MGAHKKLRWKKTLNEYRFLKEELNLIKDLAKAVAPEFQEHYENFLRERGLDLAELNSINEQEIKNAYGAEELPDQDIAPANSSCTDLAVSAEPPTKTPSAQMTEDEVIVYNLFSKLFKSIAMKVHPDKIDPIKHDYTQRRQMEEDFKRANRALDCREYFILIEIAERLAISLPKNYDQQTRWMKSQVANINTQIDREKKTYNYIFSEAETDEDRDGVIHQFVQQLFGINI